MENTGSTYLRKRHPRMVSWWIIHRQDVVHWISHIRVFHLGIADLPRWERSRQSSTDSPRYFLLLTTAIWESPENKERLRFCHDAGFRVGWQCTIQKAHATIRTAMSTHSFQVRPWSWLKFCEIRTLQVIMIVGWKPANTSSCVWVAELQSKMNPQKHSYWFSLNSPI